MNTVYVYLCAISNAGNLGLVILVMRLSDAKSKSNAVNEAIVEYVRRHKLERLKALSGRIELDENWDKLRDLELHEA